MTVAFEAIICGSNPHLSALHPFSSTDEQISSKDKAVGSSPTRGTCKRAVATFDLF